MQKREHVSGGMMFQPSIEGSKGLRARDPCRGNIFE